MFEKITYEPAKIFADSKKIVRFTVKADDYTLITDYSLETGKCIDEKFFFGKTLISGLNGYDEPTWQYTHISNLLVKYYRDALEVLFGIEFLRERN